MRHDVIRDKALPAFLYATQHRMVPVLEYCYVQDGWGKQAWSSTDPATHITGEWDWEDTRGCWDG